MVRKVFSAVVGTFLCVWFFCSFSVCVRTNSTIISTGACYYVFTKRSAMIRDIRVTITYGTRRSACQVKWVRCNIEEARRFYAFYFVDSFCVGECRVVVPSFPVKGDAIKNGDYLFMGRTKDFSSSSRLVRAQDFTWWVTLFVRAIVKDYSLFTYPRFGNWYLRDQMGPIVGVLVKGTIARVIIPCDGRSSWGVQILFFGCNFTCLYEDPFLMW